LAVLVRLGLIESYKRRRRDILPDLVGLAIELRDASSSSPFQPFPSGSIPPREGSACPDSVSTSQTSPVRRSAQTMPSKSFFQGSPPTKKFPSSLTSLP